MSIPNIHLWKMSDISEINSFMSIKTWITIKKSKVEAKDRKPVPANWLLNSKEDPDGLIRLKLIHVVKGYIQVS